MSFIPEKWYLDLVTADGTAVVGYVAGVTWEHKQLSASSLVDAAGRALDQGWAIHEVVTW